MKILKSNIKNRNKETRSWKWTGTQGGPLWYWQPEGGETWSASQASWINGLVKDFIFLFHMQDYKLIIKTVTR